MERWVQACRREPRDRTLIWNQHHLLHALPEFEAFYYEHRQYAAPGHRRRPATASAAPADHQPGPDRPVEHPTTPTTRRNPQRVRTCRLRCTDGVFGRRRARAEGAGDDPPIVHQGGPRRLWDVLDDLREEWLRRGYFQLFGARALVAHDGAVLLTRGEWRALSDRASDPDMTKAAALPEESGGFLVVCPTLTRVGGRMVDGRGRVIEVIRLDRCDGHGPQPYYRVSWHHRMLLGRGYYCEHELDAVLALVDVETLVEVVELRPAGRSA